MLKTIVLDTPEKESLTNITAAVEEVVKASGVQEGICVLYVPHTTAGLINNSGMDPATAVDLLDELRRLVPTRVDFKHQYDTPADAAGHIKSSLLGVSQTLIVTGGKLALGHSQSILFCEFDGPRQRRVIVRVMADA